MSATRTFTPGVCPSCEEEIRWVLTEEVEGRGNRPGWVILSLCPSCRTVLGAQLDLTNRTVERVVGSLKENSNHER